MQPAIICNRKTSQMFELVERQKKALILKRLTKKDLQYNYDTRILKD